MNRNKTADPVGRAAARVAAAEPTMTKMAPLLERNEQFARCYQAIALAPPAAQVLIVTCLDHRVDPAITLGLRLGDAPVIRNAGGRVTPAVIDDVAYLAFLAGELFAGQGCPDTLFEVAVVHHTQCGTGFLADAGFRRQAAEATGLAEAAAGGRRGRRPARHRQGRCRAPARLALALAEGQRVRPRVRRRDRARHHRGRRSVPFAVPRLAVPRCDGRDRAGGDTRRRRVRGQCSGGPSGRGLPPAPRGRTEEQAEAALKNKPRPH